MQTQTVERQKLHQMIDTLPDGSITAILDFIKRLRHFEAPEWIDPIEVGAWNAETLEAIREVEEGRAERFESKEALYKDLGLC